MMYTSAKENKMNPLAVIKDAIQNLEAMCEEFRKLDLPYGSKAYSDANAFINSHKHLVENNKNPPEPYFTEYRFTENRRWNSEYDQDAICECGHPYYRHFDTYEDMSDVGCKYCECHTFILAKDVEKALLNEKLRNNPPYEPYYNPGDVIVNELLGHITDLHGDARLNYLQIDEDGNLKD